MTSFISFFQ